jgi:hypothetical protein
LLGLEIGVEPLAAQEFLVIALLDQSALLEPADEIGPMRR